MTVTVTGGVDNRRRFGYGRGVGRNRVPFFEALHWCYTEHGWAAVIQLDWPRPALDRFHPPTVCIDEIIYRVTQVEIEDTGRPARVWIYTMSDLDEIPSTDRWMVDKTPGPR